MTIDIKDFYHDVYGSDMPGINLLPNSGFENWNNGTLEEIGSDLVSNGGFDSATTDWTGYQGTIASVAGGQSGNCCQITAPGGSNPQLAYQRLTFTANKIYKISVWVKSGTSGNEAIHFDLTGGATVTDTPVIAILSNIISTPTWTKHTIYYKAESIYPQPWLRIGKSTSTAGTILIDTVEVYEVTPACIGADTLGPDAWYKHSSLICYRESIEVKDGSLYAVKASVASGQGFIATPVSVGGEVWLSKIKGRAITLGMWVKSPSASNYVAIAGNVAGVTQTYHSGSDDWEWLEVSISVPTSETSVTLYYQIAVTSQDNYICQPMLVFGDYIGEGNYQPNPSDPPLVGDIESLEKKHGKTYAWDKDSGMVAKDITLTNLMLNSSFENWSYGAIEEIGSDLVSNGGFDSDTTGWTAYQGTLASVSGGQSGNCLAIERTTGTYQLAYQNLSLTENKIYKISVYIKSGTSGDEPVTLDLMGGATGLDNPTLDKIVQISSTGEWTKYSFYYKAGNHANHWLRVGKASSTAGTMLFDTVEVHEVTPAITTVTTNGPDGWRKNITSSKLYREPVEVKEGAVYSLKFVKGATVAEDIYYPIFATGVSDTFKSKFMGRTVAYGCWVKTDKTNFAIGIYDGAFTATSHSGGGDWEWLEVTTTIQNTTTEISFYMYATTGSVDDTAYFCQPMLVFGDSIGEGNYQPNPADTPIVDGVESLEKRHGKTYTWDRNKGLVTSNQTLTNLLPNSGMGVWSNSTVENVGSDLVSNGGFDSDTTNWTPGSGTIASVAGGQSGNCLELSQPGVTGAYFNNSSTPLYTIVGKFYKVIFYVKSGTSGDEAFIFKVWNAVLGSEVKALSGTTTGSWVQYSFIFKAEDYKSSLFGYKNTATIGTMLFDTISCYEVTPGCIAANSYGPDKWTKSVTSKLYRESREIKEGADYSLKFKKGLTTDEAVSFFCDSNMKPSFVKRFAGRTVTFGCWVKVDSGIAQIRLFCDANDSTITHSGSSDWEWLEISLDIIANPTYFSCALYMTTGLVDDTAYFCQPMLVFGEYIGQGNYQPIPQEVIYLDTTIASSLSKAGYSSGWLSDICPESDTECKLPANIEALYLYTDVKDSASAAANCSATIAESTNQYNVTNVFCGGVGNSLPISNTFWQRLENELFAIYILASGSGTFTLNTKYNAIQLL